MVEYATLHIGDILPRRQMTKSELEQQLDQQLQLPKDRLVQVRGVPTIPPFTRWGQSHWFMFEKGRPELLLSVNSPNGSFQQVALIAVASQRGEQVTVWGKLKVEESTDEYDNNWGFYHLEAKLVEYLNHKL